MLKKFISLFKSIRKSEHRKAAEKLLKLANWARKKNFTVLPQVLIELSEDMIEGE